MTDKIKHLAIYDYGQDVVYYFIWARSIAEVATKYPGFTGISNLISRHWPKDIIEHTPEIDIDEDDGSDGFLQLMRLTEEGLSNKQEELSAQILLSRRV